MTVIHNHCIKHIFNDKNRSRKILIVNNYFLIVNDLFKRTKKEKIFLRIAQYYIVLGGSFSSLIGCFATMDNPCINI